MLKGFIIKINKMVVVIGVNKITVAFGKGKAGAYMQFWQHNIMRVTHMENLFGIKVKVFTLLVTQIGIGVTVADDLAGVFNPDGAVVGCDNYPYLFLG